MTADKYWPGFSFAPGPIDVEGAVVNDFRLTEHLPPERAPATIEQDRPYMAARPGFNRKILPLRIERDSGVAYSGGRYLLDTYENAKEFARWVCEEFAIDGTLILERPDFADVTSRLWRVLGAHDFKDVCSAQKICRTERWIANPTAEKLLERQWTSIRDQAEEKGLSSVWLLHNEEKGEAALVTLAGSSPKAPEDALDFASILALENSPSLLKDSELGGALTKIFDRTSWVFTVWFPYREGEVNQAPLWPNSPPLPGADTEVATAA